MIKGLAITAGSSLIFLASSGKKQPTIFAIISDNIATKEMIKETSEELLWNIYFYGALRKSVDWAFQNEWRLLLPLKNKKEAELPNKIVC